MGTGTKGAARIAGAVGVATTAVLAACGGGGGITTVGGNVSGLAPGTAVTLDLNGDETLVIAGDGGFRFDRDLGAGSHYTVTIVAQPARANCTIANGSGAVDRNASRVDNIAVVCTQKHAVGGTVSGLASGTSVTLQNNDGDALAVATDGPFFFPTLLLEGAAYSVTVSQQPAGRTCNVTAGATGTVAQADATSVVVTCR